MGFCPFCNHEVQSTRDAFGNVVCTVCGSELPIEDRALPPGTIVSGFRVEEELGRGGMGVVYKATQLNLERHVALKVLSDELSRNMDFVDRFFREARSAASLSHPSIVQAFDAGATPEGIYYFAMELIEGETLESMLEREGKLPAKTVQDIATRIAEALNYAWDRQKLSHGDIKPENIIFDATGSAKLADLGLAKTAHEEDNDKDIMATPLYAPPEIIRGDIDTINTRSDMYSFGATVYQMLAGNPPFPERDPHEALRRHLEETPKPLIEVDREIPSGFSKLVDQLLSKDPNERPEDWAEVVKSLGHAAKGGGKVFTVHHHESDGHSTSSEQPAAGMNPIKWCILGGVALLLLLCSAAVGLILVNNGDKSGDGGGITVKENVNRLWGDLKKKLELLTPEGGLSEIQAFKEKYGPDLPADVDRVEKQLQKLIAQHKKDAESKVKELAAYKTEKESLLKALKSKKYLKMPYKDLPVLEKLLKRLEGCLGACERKKHLAEVISAADRKVFNDHFLGLSGRISKLKQDEAKRIAAEEAAKEKERLEAERKKREQHERDRQQRFARNAIIDGYYIAIGDYFSPKKNDKHIPEALLGFLKEWRVNEKQLPADYRSRRNFLMPLLESCKPPKEILIKNDLLKEVALPPSVYEGGFTVSSADSKALRLYQVDGKVKIGRKVRWSSLKDFDRLLELVFTRKENAQLPRQDLESVILFYSLKGEYDRAKAYLRLFTNIKSGRKRLWDTILADFERAPKERQAIELWQTALASEKTKALDEAVRNYVQLSVQCRDTDFYSRYKTDIEEASRRYIEISPDMQALDFLIREQGAKNADQRLYIVMAANGRYAGLRQLSGSTRAALQAKKVEVLMALKTNSKVKSLDDNRVPFYYWTHEHIGDAWVFAQIVKQSQLGSNPVMPFLSVAADVEVGNWDSVRELLAGPAGKPDKLMRVSKQLHPWQPSLLYGTGLAARQNGDIELQRTIASYLFQLTHNQAQADQFGILSRALAIEYALATRDYRLARRIGDTVDAGTVGSQLYGGRLAMLHLLSIVNTPGPASIARLRQAIRLYAPAMQKASPRLNGDVWCMRLAERMLGDSYQITAKDINHLGKARCFFPDTSSRLIMDVMTRRIVEGAGPQPAAKVNELVDLLAANIDSKTIGNALWEKILVFRVAQAYNDREMSRVCRRALGDTRLCALPSYPKLRLLVAGTDMIRGRYSADVIRNTYTGFLDGSQVASDDYLKIADLIKLEDSSQTVTDLFVKGKQEMGFWGGMLSCMSSYRKQPVAAAKLLGAMDTYRTGFTWQEAYLSDAMARKLQSR